MHLRVNFGHEYTEHMLVLIIDRSHLHKHSEEDDGDDGGEEHVLQPAVGQQKPQRVRDGTSQATVGHDELVFFGQLHNTEFIDDVREADDS